jgi:hypothetical protein
MISKGKKIVFTSTLPELEILSPIPASKAVPEWFRKMPGVKDGQMSIKKCIPFLDSLTSGYIIPLASDMFWNKESKKFISQSEIDLNADHVFSQTEEIILPPEYDRQPHKWINFWHIKTPPGYSTLFVHPFNRQDLPFQTIGGIVDTDRHQLAVNFPFFLRKDFSGTILKGTPMVLAIPFKRDNWTSSLGGNEDIRKVLRYQDDSAARAMNPPFGNYKRRWWTKKEYR